MSDADKAKKKEATKKIGKALANTKVAKKIKKLTLNKLSMTTKQIAAAIYMATQKKRIKMSKNLGKGFRGTVSYDPKTKEKKASLSWQKSF